MFPVARAGSSQSKKHPSPTELQEPSGWVSAWSVQRQEGNQGTGVPKNPEEEG